MAWRLEFGCPAPVQKARDGCGHLHFQLWFTLSQQTKNSRAWWCTLLIPALGRQRQRQRQRQVDFWVRGQPGLQSEFQGSRTAKAIQRNPESKKQKKKKKGKEFLKASASPWLKLVHRNTLFILMWERDSLAPISVCSLPSTLNIDCIKKHHTNEQTALHPS
jgi:hypothetical protein